MSIWVFYQDLRSLPPFYFPCPVPVPRFPQLGLKIWEPVNAEQDVGQCRTQCVLHRSILFSLKWWVFWLSAVAWCFCFTKSDQSISLQAKFIAEIIIVGAQVVGRAFTQALRQELQSKFKWCNRSLECLHLFICWIGSRTETSIVLFSNH